MCGLIGGDVLPSSFVSPICSDWCGELIVFTVGGVIDVGGELMIDKSPVDRIIATGRAIGGNGGGGNIELYCE